MDLIKYLDTILKLQNQIYLKFQIDILETNTNKWRKIYYRRIKNLENQILGAEEKVINLEYNVFVEVRDKIEAEIQRIQRSASIISTLDVLCSFAIVAEDQNYVKPIVNDSGVIDIKDGRHPVIEKILPSGSFVQMIHI